MDQKQVTWTVVMFIGAVLIMGIFLYINNNQDKKKDYGNLDNFAQCLTDKGFVMYGAVWCGNCLNEKKNFGDSFRLIKYVECPDNIQLCLAKGINGYPTWTDSAGNKYEGEQGIEGLARLSGCELPQN